MPGEDTGIDAFAEAEALVDEFGPGPPGSDAERRAAQHLAGRLEELGREAETETFAVWPAWATAYAINCVVAVIGSVVAVSSATLGTGLVLLATIATFLDLAGILPTTRRLLGRRASQNVVSWGDRDRDGAVILVAHYDTGPLRTRPLSAMFLAMLVLLACCVLRAGGMEGTALTVVQFIPTVVLIVYVALLLDVVLSPAAPAGRQRLRRGRRPPPRGAARRPRLLRRARALHRLAEGDGPGDARFLRAHREGCQATRSSSTSTRSAAVRSG